MERAIEETMQRAKFVYELVSGRVAPAISPETPYARIPPEVDAEQHLLDQAKSLFDRVNKARRTRSVRFPMKVERSGEDVCYHLELASARREQISLELQGSTIRVALELDDRVEQIIFLPTRVEANAVRAALSEERLTIRVRLPIIDDTTHKIEIR